MDLLVLNEMEKYLEKEKLSQEEIISILENIEKYSKECFISKLKLRKSSDKSSDSAILGIENLTLSEIKKIFKEQREITSLLEKIRKQCIENGTNSDIEKVYRSSVSAYKNLQFRIAVLKKIALKDIGDIEIFNYPTQEDFKTLYD